MSVAVAPERRFWHKAERVGDCWVWRSVLDDKGYGRFYPTGRVHVFAHRFAYALMHGPLSKTTVIRHTCDNPPCINPEHLVAGTQMDNVRDRDERNRTSKGPAHYRWRQFSADEFRSIIEDGQAGLSVRRIAAAHHTRRATVHAILAGERDAGG